MNKTSHNAFPPNIADDIRRLADEAPPLSPAQRDKLALLLRGGEVSRTDDLDAIHAGQFK